MTLQRFFHSRYPIIITAKQMQVMNMWIACACAMTAGF
jgi:hypothetical protein